MCGIVGFLDKLGRTERPLGQTLLAMLEALGCRGPDSAGVAIFGLVSLTYYGINAWLPSSFTERGWSHASAGALLTVVNGVTVPVNLFLAMRGDLFGSRRFWLVSGATLQLSGLLGVILAPGGGWGWAVLIGAGIGLLFPSMMPEAESQTSSFPPLAIAVPVLWTVHDRGIVWPKRAGARAGRPSRCRRAPTPR